MYLYLSSSVIVLQTVQSSASAREELNGQVSSLRAELSSERTAHQAALEERAGEAAQLREQLQQALTQAQLVGQQLHSKEQVMQVAQY